MHRQRTATLCVAKAPVPLTEAARSPSLPSAALQASTNAFKYPCAHIAFSYKPREISAPEAAATEEQVSSNHF
jgi:hypothetical protein